MNRLVYLHAGAKLHGAGTNLEWNGGTLVWHKENLRKNNDLTLSKRSYFASFVDSFPYNNCKENIRKSVYLKKFSDHFCDF